MSDVETFGVSSELPQMEIETSDSRLLGFILFNSFQKGRLFYVKAVGHTNNTGGNGAGKSSLLSLLPAFYGAEPSKLVDRQANKSSFIDYYLPSSKSVIAFEYLKEGGHMCAVLFRNGHSVAYRFVECEAKALFTQPLLDELNTSGTDAKTWLKERVSAIFETSIQIEATVDYRAVILNDKSRLHSKGRLNHRLLSTANQFSLCSANHSMLHIDILTATMMRHKSMLSRFKSMVVDCFLAPQASLSESPFRRDDLEHIDGLESLVGLYKHQEKFEQAIAKKHELDELWSEMQVFDVTLEFYLNEVNHELSKANDHRFMTREKLKQLKKTTEETLKDLRKTASELKTHFSDIESKVNGIHKQNQVYHDEMDIETMVAEYNALSTYVEQRQAAIEHYNTLVKGVEKETSAHEIKVANLNNKHLNFERSINDKIRTYESKIQAVKDGLAEQVKKEVQQCAAEVKDVNQTAEKEKGKLQDQINALYVEKGTASNLTEEESSNLSKIEGDIKSLSEEHTQSQKAIIELMAEKERIKGEHSGWLGSFNEARTKLVNIQQEIAETTKLLTPEPSTFAEYLGRVDLSWWVFERHGKAL